MSDEVEGLRDKLARQSEETVSRFAQELLENPIVTGAMTRAFAARERAAGAQEAAMGALNIPSAGDVERLTRRLRSVSQRLEGIEDAFDRLERRLERSGSSAESSEAVLAKLDDLTAEVARLAAAIESGGGPVASKSSAESSTVKRAPAKRRTATDED